MLLLFFIECLIHLLQLQSLVLNVENICKSEKGASSVFISIFLMLYTILFSVVDLSKLSEHQFLKRAECRKTVKHKKSKEQSRAEVEFLSHCPLVNSIHILLTLY